MTNPTIVRLRNEDGVPTYWAIGTSDETYALQEAWRAYRDLTDRDGELPPSWTKATIVEVVEVQ